MFIIHKYFLFQSTNSSSGSGQMTKVTATAKFKMEVFTPAAETTSSRPASRSSRSRRSSSSNGAAPADPLRSSGDSSLASSLNSDPGFSEK